VTKPKNNAAAMSIEQVARVLAKSGHGEITTEMIEADIGDGAPLNDDGTLHLIHYTAWLASQHVAWNPNAAK